MQIDLHVKYFNTPFPSHEFIKGGFHRQFVFYPFHPPGSFNLIAVNRKKPNTGRNKNG
jgi:hypothetical protein